MHPFAVWAPSADQVSLRLPASDTSVPLHRDDGGWWRAEVTQAGPGTDYAYSVDGREPRPDPRSAWQPAGVHGTSRVFDASAFAWSDDGWRGRDVRGALFYELHVGTFTPEGTLDAAQQRLDHLVELGVDVVQLMPVAAFPGRWGWGYDGVALYAVHEPYGGPAALQRFVDACHRRGLAVALDVVYNHLGPSGNYLSMFGPYFTAKHETPWGQAVNLDDEGCEQVRRYLVDNALRWFRDFHLDALRLDAVHALVDDSPVHLQAQLSTETADLAKELGRPLGLVAESDLNDPRMVRPVDEGGLGMTAQWSDDFHHSLHSLLTGERQGYYVDFGELATFAHAETRVFVHDGGFSTFRGSDWGVPVDPERDHGHSFLAYDQNHDQVGNRALGDRPTATISSGLAAVSAALVLTSPYTPMLFMGEEWAASTPWQFFTDHSEPELAEAIREGRRREFAEHGWSGDEVPDPQDPSTRDASVLRWDEVDDPRHARMLGWYRQLVALRRTEGDLRDDRLDGVHVRFDDERRWLVVERGGLRVAVNLATREQLVPLGASGIAVLAAWGGAELDGTDVAVPAESVTVVRVA
ncbi:MAG: malto-oligosyltrehalose trehalohydrolase [Actinomycetes bacterium]